MAKCATRQPVRRRLPERPSRAKVGPGINHPPARPAQEEQFRLLAPFPPCDRSVCVAGHPPSVVILCFANDSPFRRAVGDARPSCDGASVPRHRSLSRARRNSLTFDLVDFVFLNCIRIELVELAGLRKLNHDRRALVEAERSGLESAAEDMSSDAAIVAQEMPVVARYVERAHPRRTTQPDEGTPHVMMLTNDLVFDDFDQRPKRGRLNRHAA